MYGTGSRLCPIAGFDISSTETSGSAIIVLVMLSTLF
jgi:hypothetical protein